MQYVEMTVEEALECCNKYTKVLIAVQDLEEVVIDIMFAPKYREEGYQEIFQDIQTIAALKDGFIEQLNLFTEKQNLVDVLPIGILKIIFLKEKEIPKIIKQAF